MDEGAARSGMTDIAIVGGGASGTLLAWHLVTRHGRPSTLIDPAPRPGLGLAYATTQPLHLLNVRADGMSADAERPQHFLDWLRAHHDPAARPETFAPRMVYGRYLQSLLGEAAPHHVQARAIGCTPDGQGYAITLDDGRMLYARRVVLATGNFDPARLPGVDATVEAAGRYHHHAWDAALYARLPAEAPIALIGTGLTTVDAILSLRSAGHRGRIEALSRHGLLPARHAPFPAAAQPAIADDVPPTAAACFAAFRAALDHGMPWRAAIDSLRFRTNAIWCAASETDKARFRRHLQRRWEVARHRMAPPIADVMDALRDDGTLHLHQAHVHRITLDDRLPGARIEGDGPHGAVTLRAAHVINCTGPDLRYDRVGSPLLSGLLASGLARPGRAGAGLACTEAGEIRAGLYAMGPPRLGTLFESIAIPDLRRQAQALADLLQMEKTAISW